MKMSAMNCIIIREATAQDAPVIAGFLRLMLEEMASMGGHDVSRSNEEWAHIEKGLRDEIGSKDHMYLLACPTGSQAAPIGLAEARVVSPASVFEPKRILHLHAVHVLEMHRRRGIGQTLLEAILDWGRRSDCVEAELNTLVRNPARSLYEKIGFSEFEIKMVRRL